MNKQLPIIDSCDNCGACCLEQQSPPGYGMLLGSPEMLDEAEALFPDDVERFRNLPKDAVAELRRYVERVLAEDTLEDRACIWLDCETMKCRFHDHRPMICRDFELGSDECRGWRDQYGIAQN